MNKSVIVAIVVIAAIVVGVPLIAKVMQSSGSSSGSTDSNAAGSDAAPAATTAPALDANSLTNSQWSMKVDKVTLTVTFLPNGVLQAQSPMLKVLVGTDTVGGTWAVNGANLNITATAGDQTVSETAIISGDQILVKGNPAKRLQ
ncbi:MAG TPA: hypothetical protein VMZ06_01585 [Candidatus Bathyarchaeia archaeon]|nr:hypothetical protein [Candidatus Bathyarchaeia archaeon]